MTDRTTFPDDMTEAPHHPHVTARGSSGRPQRGIAGARDANSTAAAAFLIFPLDG
jgi:hypothetical protein